MKSCKEMITDVSTVASILRDTNVTLQQGKWIHTHILTKRLADIFLGNLLVQMYHKVGSLNDAEQVFRNMPWHNLYSWNIMLAGYIRQGNLKNAFQFFEIMPCKDVISWTAMLTAYVQHDHLKEAFHFFWKMPHRDVVSWNVMIAAYTQHGQIREALQLFQQMPKQDVVSWTTILVAYARQGFLKDALDLFQQMPQKDIVSWNIMVASCAQQEQLGMAVELFRQMPFRNIVSWNTMIAAYAEQGLLKEALELFLQMPQRNIISWTTMITGYAQVGLLREALNFFSHMQQEGIKADRVAFVSLLDACAKNGALFEGKQVHGYIVNFRLEEDLVVRTALMNMYAKCGGLCNACMLFEKISQPDGITWNAMLAAYAQHGHGRSVIRLSRRMGAEGFALDESAFCCILSGCGHVGMVDEASHCFVAIVDHEVTPTLEHYNCLVDLLRRLQWLDVAENLILNMPFLPGTSSWTSLFVSCKQMPDVQKIVNYVGLNMEKSVWHKS